MTTQWEANPKEENESIIKNISHISNRACFKAFDTFTAFKYSNYFQLFTGSFRESVVPERNSQDNRCLN